MNWISETFLKLLLIIFILIIKIYYLPGMQFSKKLWDDELGLKNDFVSRSNWAWLTYRDAPGYFVPLPRLIYKVSESIPYDQVLTIRLSVYLVSILSLVSCTTMAFNYRTNRTAWILLFFSLNSFFIEDINYLHNVSYLLIFPAILLLNKAKGSINQIKIFYLLIFILLINKPITALTILTIVIIEILVTKSKDWFTYLIILYLVFYLSTYLILPHRWETPTNTNFWTLVPMLLNIFYVFMVTILPSIYIGLLGILHEFESLNYFFLLIGLLGYLLPFIFILLNRKNIRNYLIKIIHMQDNLYYTLIVGCTYFFAYTNKQISWIENFPIYLGSQRIFWTRWTSPIPYAVVILITKLLRESKRRQAYFVGFILVQNMILLLVARNYIKRWW